MMKFQFRAQLIWLLTCLFALATSCRTEPKTQIILPDFKRTSNSVITAERSEPEGLNPMLSYSLYANNVMDHIFQYLMTIDPQTLEFTPALVKSKPQIEAKNDNGQRMQYTFELRAEAQWDNGTPVLASDVVFSLKTLLNPKGNVGLLSFIEPIKAILLFPENPRKFTLVLDGNNVINEAIASAGFAIIPEYHYDPSGLLKNIPIEDLLDRKKATEIAAKNSALQQFAEQFSAPQFAREPEGISGSGPYRLKSWTTGQTLVLERKQNWWGSPYAKENTFFQAKVSEIIYQPIADGQTANIALQGEQIDVRANIAPTDFDALTKDGYTPNFYELTKAPTFNYGLWYINTKNKKLNDKRVRRALAHLLNVDEIIETVHNGLVERIVSPILPMMLGYNDQLKPIPFNVDNAKALLAQAGWQDSNNNGIVDKMIDGELVEMNLDLLCVAGAQTQQDMALIFKEDALKAGVNVDIIAKESVAMRGDMNKRNFDLVQSGLSIPTPWIFDPKQSWHTESDTPDGFNRSGFGHAISDALIDEIRVTQDAKKRAALYKQFQEIVYEEQPVLFLYGLPNFIAIHKRFKTKTYALRPGYFPGTFDLILN